MSIPFSLTPFPSERFQRLDLLGQGGMGKVYKARDRHLNRMVALKFLLVDDDPIMIQRLVLEAQYLASLEHPNIVAVHGVGTWEGSPCVVMQYVAGMSLDRLGPGLDLAEAVALLAQAARGVHAAHCQGLIHRDLKPQNILVEEAAGGGRQAFVADFGLARVSATQSLTISCAIHGSPCYMSPEQASGGTLLDARSDIYSLTATLYALVTGVPPFQDQLASGPAPDLFQESWVAPGAEPGAAPLPRKAPEPQALEILRRVLDQPPTAPRRLNPRIPASLENILVKGMEKQPHRRYASAEALAEDLERFLAGRPVQAQRPTWSRRLRAGLRRYPTLSAVVGVGLGLGLLGGLAMAWAARQAHERSDLAAHFEREAQDIAVRFAMISLTPFHDRTAEVAAIQARVTAFQEEARRLGSVARAPCAFASGNVHLVLGQNRLALQELRYAWQLGLRRPDLAHALGLAQIQIYLEEAQRAGSIGALSPTEREALAHTYLEPGRVLLNGAGMHPDDEPLIPGWLALMKREDASALALAEATLRTAPWRYQAHLLAARVWQERAKDATSLAEVRACATEVERQLDQALAIGRSDPQAYTMKAEWLNFLGWMIVKRYALPDPALHHRALEACQAALRLDPDNERATITLAQILLRIPEMWEPDGPATATLPRYDQAVAGVDRILLRHPQSVPVLLIKGWMQHQEATRRQLPAAGTRMALEQGLAFAQRAAAVDASNCNVLNLQMYLHLSLGRLADAQGSDPRPALRAGAAVQERLEALWPTLTEFKVMGLECQFALAEAEARFGDPAAAQGALLRARNLGETGIRAGGAIPTLSAGIAATYRLENLLAEARGNPDPGLLARAGQALARVPARDRTGFTYTDESYSIGLEKIRMAIRRGEGICPTLRELDGLMATARRAGVSLGWRMGNLAVRDLLEARQARRLGRDPQPFLREGQERLRRSEGRDGEFGSVFHAGTQGALLAQAALDQQGPGRQALQLRARRLLEQARAREYCCLGMFQDEWNLVRRPLP